MNTMHSNLDQQLVKHIRKKLYLTKEHTQLNKLNKI